MPTSLTEQAATLIGEWHRITQSACSARYPAVIRFEAKGLFRAEPDQPGAFSVWDVGRYSFDAPAQLRLSTANDAEVVYRFTGDARHFSVIAPDGCELAFERRTG